MSPRFSLVVVLSVVYIDMLGIGLAFPVLPRLIEEFKGGDVSRASYIYGLLAAAYSLMQFLLAPLLGALSDRYGRRPVILLALVGMGINYLLLAFAATSCRRPRPSSFRAPHSSPRPACFWWPSAWPRVGSRRPPAPKHDNRCRAAAPSWRASRLERRWRKHLSLAPTAFERVVPDAGRPRAARGPRRRPFLKGVSHVPTPRSRRHSRRALGFSTLLAALGLAACGEPPVMPASPPVEVGVIDVQPRTLQLDLEYPAQLKGAREVEVRARVSGILLERRYEEGARVAAGDVLFRIDPDPFRAAVARARAQVGVQQALLNQARRERDRIVPLYEQKLASLRERDTALAAFEGAEAAVAAAQAALRTAELDLSYTDVRAPIAGITSREVRSEGSLVTAGDDSSLLTYIVQDDRLYVDIAVADGEADLVRAAVASGSEPAVQVSDAEGRAIGGPAPIEFISPRIDDSTGTVAIRAVLENPGGIVPGRIVRARVMGVTVPNALVIPKRAVMFGAAGAYVWTVGDGGIAAVAPVELGAFAGNDVVVARGLAAGARVVVDGILKVFPGAPVNAQPIAAEGAGP